MLLAGRTAHAEPGFAANRFEPAVRGSDWFSVDGLDFRGELRPAYGLTLDYARKPLVLYDLKDKEVGAPLSDALYGHLGAALVIQERLRFGLSLPLALVQGGRSYEIDLGRFSGASGASFGDIRLDADIRMFGDYDGPGRLGVGVALYLPTGSPGSYTGDGKVHVRPRLQFAGQAGQVAYAARVDYHVRPEHHELPTVGNDLGLGLALGGRLLDGALLLGPELQVAASTSSTSEFLSNKSTAVELLFGGHYTHAESWRFGAGVGPGLTTAPGTPAIRLIAEASYLGTFVPPDKDADGIPDKEDFCPTVPGVRTGDPRTHGCPLPPDTDRDGIRDPQDACPTQPGPTNADPKKHGCPPPPDADGDGIVDGEDACPTQPGPRTPDPQTNGCPPPPPPPPDRDKDTILDAEDACPDVPGIKTPDPKTNGCGDKDGDTIFDPEDACPDVAGPRDPDPKKSGCPVARLEAQQIVIREQVKFATKSTKILPDSDPIIAAVAEVLTQHPEILTLRVEGHTDNVGGAAFNKRLSQGRAAAVAKALVGKGIDKKRLKSAGFGKDKPIDSNDTEQGRANNRRVELHVEKQQDKQP